MYDENLDALAAEYVLGTLAADERARAEALIDTDPGFVEIVHQWERRLGELNVMVEAVEPPAEVWDRIKAEIGSAPAEDVQLAPRHPSPPAPPMAASEATNPTETDGQAATDDNAEGNDAAQASAMSSPQSPPESPLEEEAQAKPQTELPAQFRLRPPSPQGPPTTGPNADVMKLIRRVRRWRSVSLLTAAIAVILAAFVAALKFDPGLIPPQVLTFPVINTTPKAAAPIAPRPRELIGVLQQDPTAPAFVVAIDPASRVLTVRRMVAMPQPGHSFELWWFPANSGKPRSLGLVGGSEYTQHSLPADFDADALRDATYKISYERAAGSQTGAPSGPILFTGKLVDSIPPAPALQMKKTK
jgi:anti-sigma-K factor RskA